MSRSEKLWKNLKNNSLELCLLVAEISEEAHRDKVSKIREVAEGAQRRIETDETNNTLLEGTIGTIITGISGTVVAGADRVTSKEATNKEATNKEATVLDMAVDADDDVVNYILYRYPFLSLMRVIEFFSSMPIVCCFSGKSFQGRRQRRSSPRCDRIGTSNTSMTTNSSFLPSLKPSARAADPAWNAKLTPKDELRELERAEEAYKDSVGSHGEGDLEIAHGTSLMKYDATISLQRYDIQSQLRPSLAFLDSKSLMRWGVSLDLQDGPKFLTRFCLSDARSARNRRVRARF